MNQDQGHREPDTRGVDPSKSGAGEARDREREKLAAARGDGGSEKTEPESQVLHPEGGAGDAAGGEPADEDLQKRQERHDAEGADRERVLEVVKETNRPALRGRRCVPVQIVQSAQSYLGAAAVLRYSSRRRTTSSKIAGGTRLSRARG